MSKICFLADKSATYDVTFAQIGEHQVRLVFEDIKPSDKILLSGFNLVNEHNGYIQTVRTGYTNIYRTYDNNSLMIELCDDGIEYVEPDPIITPNPETYVTYEEILNNIPNIINIDHHDTNERFGTINIVSAKASSTCEVLYIIAKASNFEFNNMIAKELYQGIITDTNCFTSRTITKRTHQVASELLTFKFDSDAIKEYYFKNNSVGKMKLLSKALQSLKFYKGERFTTMRIPNELFSKFDASFEDTLGIIDNGINISGTEVSAILIEREPNKIYASLRSKGRVDVGEIAKEVGSRLGGSGGGSANIAAFQAEGVLKEVESALAESVSPKLEDIENDDEIIF